MRQAAKGDLEPVAERLLWLLKTRGEQTAFVLADLVQTGAENIRQQLNKLAAAGLVTSQAKTTTRGRPSRSWRLTAAGHARFPDRHGDLTVQLIQAVRAELGEDALDRLIQARERKTAETYRAAMAGAPDLRARVAALANVRSREGYMAEWRDDGDGFLLVENHCPICAAAMTCQGFCRSELELFREVLGPGAKVTRVEHLPSGARRCAYKITG